jgi:hypothetical protein
MALISVFYPKPCEGQPYTKAIVPGSAVPFFISEFGFFKTQAEAIEAQGTETETETDPDKDPDEIQAGGAEAYVASGDKGCGALNSKEWYITQIKQAGTKQSVLDIIKEVTGKAPRKKFKKVADLKTIAIKIIERKFDGNG